MEWVVVENPEPDPESDALLDWLAAWSRKADEYWIWTSTGPAREE